MFFQNLKKYNKFFCSKYYLAILQIKSFMLAFLIKYSHVFYLYQTLNKNGFNENMSMIKPKLD
jgi:hypothetical protein